LGAGSDLAGRSGVSRLRLASEHDQARSGDSMSAPIADAASASSTVDRGGERTLLPGQSPAGEYILSVLVKRTYAITPGQCVRADKDRPILGGDVHWDHPMNSSVRYETVFGPFKVATDV